MLQVHFAYFGLLHRGHACAMSIIIKSHMCDMYVCTVFTLLVIENLDSISLAIRVNVQIGLLGTVPHFQLHKYSSYQDK